MYQKSKAVLLMKLQAQSGVDAVPTAADAFLVEDPSIEPVVEKLERNNVRPQYGSKEFLVVGKAYKIGFSVEFSGQGGTTPVLTTPPPIGRLLRATYMTQTVVSTPGSECVKYAFHDDIDNAEELTIYFFMDGILHKAIGCIGTHSFDPKVNQFAKLKFEYQGIYAGPVQQAPATITGFANDVTPPIFRSALFAIDNYAAVIENFKFDMKGDIAERPDANAATGVLKFYMKDRQATAEIDPEVPDMSVKDFWTMWESAEKCAMTCRIGTVSGNRCTINAPNVQIDDLKYADRNNILTYGMPLRVLPPVAGGSEVEYIFD